MDRAVNNFSHPRHETLTHLIMKYMSLSQHIREDIDRLNEILGEEPIDWDQVIYTMTDETLEEMANDYAWTVNAPNTTPIV